MEAHAAQTTSLTQPKLAGPLYNQIQILMRERILAQEWSAGKALPTEVELAREYNVSVGTMRKALDVLEDAKFIVRKQGLGTFVRELDTANTKQPGWLIDGKLSVERIIRVISVAATQPSNKECSALDIGPRSIVHRVKLVSSFQRRGIVLDEYIISDTTGFASERTDADGLQQALQRLEQQAARYTERFTVETTTPALSHILRIDTGLPLLRIERAAFDSKGRTLFTCVRLAHLDGASYKVEVDSP